MKCFGSNVHISSKVKALSMQFHPDVRLGTYFTFFPLKYGRGFGGRQVPVIFPGSELHITSKNDFLGATTTPAPLLQSS